MHQYIYLKEPKTWSVKTIKYESDTAQWFIEYFLYLAADREMTEHDSYVFKTINTRGVGFAQVYLEKCTDLSKKWGIPHNANGIIDLTSNNLSSGKRLADDLLELMTDCTSIVKDDDYWDEIKRVADTFTKVSFPVASGEYVLVVYAFTVKEFIFELLRLAIDMEDHDGINTERFKNVVANNIDSL